MFDRKSDVALNKNDPDAIVYTSVKGVHIRLIPDDFSSQAEFKKWKKWSDEDYCQREHTDGSGAKCYSLDENRDSDDGLSSEDMMMARLTQAQEKKQADKQQEDIQEQIQRLKQLLTKTQYRRLWMYFVDGLSVKEIAQQEKVTTRRIFQSLQSAHKRIMNNL